MDRLTDAQLEALFKIGNQDSLLAALHSIYEAGIAYGQANPDTVIVNVPAPAGV